MAKVMTLSGLGADKASGERCKCIYNPRTKRRLALCYVQKPTKGKPGWRFRKGGC